MIHDAITLWLILLHLSKASPRKILTWLANFPSIQAFFAADDLTLRDLGLSEVFVEGMRNPDWKVIASELDWAAQNNHHIIPYDHPDYPSWLKEISAPPLLLFVHGNPAILNHRQIAMVGTRQASFNGLRNANHFAQELVKTGFVITSGLARGIDQACHQGALQASGLTIATFGTGLLSIYPKSHRALAASIVASGGALISEFPLATPPLAANFPRRNRIIAGLCQGVVVVEAALRSGSLITARIAMEEGREVFALPGSIHHPMARGCHYLIKQGAKLVESVTDILEELETTPLVAMHRQSVQNSTGIRELSPQATKLLQQIDYETTPIDVILLRSQLTTSEVSSILLSLELYGLIQSISGGYVRIAATTA